MASTQEVTVRKSNRSKATDAKKKKKDNTGMAKTGAIHMNLTGAPAFTGAPASAAVTGAPAAAAAAATGAPTKSSIRTSARVAAAAKEHKELETAALHQAAVANQLQIKAAATAARRAKLEAEEYEHQRSNQLNKRFTHAYAAQTNRQVTESFGAANTGAVAMSDAPAAGTGASAAAATGDRHTKSCDCDGCDAKRYRKHKEATKGKRMACGVCTGECRCHSGGAGSATAAAHKPTGGYASHTFSDSDDD